MFTGIVQRKAKIISIDKKEQLHTLEVALDKVHQDGLVIGASIANNGTCLTVVKMNDNSVCFDVIEETLKVTNLVDLEIGDEVNLERAAKFGDEIGGHLLSGHVHTQAKIVTISRTETNCDICFQIAPEWQKYVLPKGFISIDGISLTLGDVADGHFWVHLIPETLSVTNLGSRRVGQFVNIEIDSQTQAIVDTVERMMVNK
ncbi:riboflavin synthase [Moritella viscosa]|uniref:Riboflavin synthase n=1 Tax=Moritella viscosa TaxID=80854 RepID=A0A090IDG3_9GAMM|nr:riboflavin synthase [Moritella viscosa]CED60325.1 riboflavin synthase, alpha chain [Moritella viscosa]SGY98183.1 Riboflavin synthase subunit alpha [Moritella viscosa]SGZ05023.1 Riboflavin synthase subunit alpha [Moritella viscosa]SGZ11988.1 Riboflavin synthase subunit alpha [Moritella viscosa]SGZ12144.1 Riboflavin synthase subunit alpha [Moritella viscosa]